MYVLLLRISLAASDNSLTPNGLSFKDHLLVHVTTTHAQLEPGAQITCPRLHLVVKW